MEQQAVAEQARREAAEARAAQEGAVEPGQDNIPDDEAHERAAAPTPAPMSLDDRPRHIPSRPVQPFTSAARGTSNENTTKRVRISPVVQQEQAPFPALYRVVKDDGAPVWNESHDAVSRTVPFGVVVLCQSLKWKQDKGFMMRLPDGWVHEDTVVRIRTLASLKQSSQQQQRQHVKAD